jgi:hypothetical protein
MYRLDRTAFRRQSAEEAANQYEYWQTKSLVERLRASFYLNSIAWGFTMDDPPRLTERKKTENTMAKIFNQDFVDFIQALNNHEVEYVLAGGYAVILHGYPRVTGDIDIWVNQTAENYQKLQRAFEEFGMPMFDMTEENFLNNPDFDVFSFGVPPVSIDVMTKMKGLDFSTVFTRAQHLRVQNLEVNLISLEDLKTAKKAAGRPKDLNDLENLEDL